MEQSFDNFISLGWFCAMARALEATGLRTQSSPFDWCISSWYGVEKALSTHFEGYLDEEFLAQEIEEKSRYKNVKYGIAFYHDFDQFRSLHEQLPAVREKYERRIQNFYKSIEKPTLFFRYICTDDGYDEWNYVMSNYQKIMTLLKSFNSENEIVFLYKKTDEADDSNRKTLTKGIRVFPVEPGGVLVQSGEEFGMYLNTFCVPEQQKNIDVYKSKQKKKHSIMMRLRKKAIYYGDLMRYGIYSHDKKYSHIDERKWE